MAGEDRMRLAASTPHTSSSMGSAFWIVLTHNPLTLIDVAAIASYLGARGGEARLPECALGEEA
eukprot:CAMPEP_0179886372 /NCGR_PEP_ID=MMETSP0982-20121206/30809_1 /TAXON_ID=483367 /ORGANISM="non described non described, Strain CCMP 2436" /LENGTH=63 /DNA_ID=CAMNT_0021782075 /DNA_START=459 /DNA_END=651 /DNA_ORIENTATION=-